MRKETSYRYERNTSVKYWATGKGRPQVVAGTDGLQIRKASTSTLNMLYVTVEKMVVFQVMNKALNEN
jgi:hypothetical protein